MDYPEKDFIFYKFMHNNKIFYTEYKEPFQAVFEEVKK